MFWTYTFFFEQSACWCRLFWRISDWCRLFWRNRSRKPLLQIRPWRDRAPARFAESQLCLASHIAMLATCLIGIAFYSRRLFVRINSHHSNLIIPATLHWISYWVVVVARGRAREWPSTCAAKSPSEISPLMMRALLALQEAGGWTRVSMTVKSKYKNAANRSI